MKVVRSAARIIEMSEKGLFETVRRGLTPGKRVLLFEKMGYQAKARYEKKGRKSDAVENAKHNHKRENRARKDR